MSKLQSLILATALVTASPALAQPVRVRAPAAQEFLTTAGECSAKIAQPQQRRTCFACVNRGGRFNLTSSVCDGVAVPQPPPPHQGQGAIRSVQECDTIPGPKRNRCVSCVTGNGIFLAQGNGYGYCKAGTVPPPPPPPPVDRTIQRTIDECNSEIPNPEKRLRCNTCIQGGGTYYKNQGNGRGQCTAPPPPAETSVLRTVSDCTAYVKGPRRVRCVSCVQGGGTFMRHEGKGECTMPPPPAPAMLRSADECSAQVPNKKQRKQCMRCVARGAAFQADNGSCVAPPVETITSADDCNSKVTPEMRKACRKCAKKGGRWDVNGSSCQN